MLDIDSLHRLFCVGFSDHLKTSVMVPGFDAKRLNQHHHSSQLPIAAFREKQQLPCGIVLPLRIGYKQDVPDSTLLPSRLPL
jgi:hypothetical protein